jgi:hypothetical protein
MVKENITILEGNYILEIGLKIKNMAKDSTFMRMGNDIWEIF